MANVHQLEALGQPLQREVFRSLANLAKQRVNPANSGRFVDLRENRQGKPDLQEKMAASS